MFHLRLTAVALARLACLGLACAETPIDNPLRRIALLITGATGRFLATDGRLLVVLSVPVIWDDDEAPKSMTLLLDQAQLTAMATAMRRVASTTVDLGVTISQRQREVRFAHQGLAHLVRLHEGSYPDIDATLSRFRDSSWVPSLQSFDHHLLGVAAKIAGRKGLLPLCVPVAGNSPLRTAWQTSAPPTCMLPAIELRQALSMPAMWADDSVLILLMGISRFGADDGVDLAPFLPTATPTAASAVA